MNFGDFKILLSEWMALDKDALHIHAALFLYFGAMLALRRSPRSVLPWLIVFAAEVANEGYDLWQQQADGEPPRPAEGLKDFWNTMLWPSALLLLGRWLAPAEAQAPPDERATG